jgi:DNA mismatch repair ATPase MutS
VRLAVNTSLRGTTLNEFIVSIIEHTTHEVGLAVYNVNSGEVFLSQIIERMTYVQTISTLSRFTPREIIYCSNH